MAEKLYTHAEMVKLCDEARNQGFRGEDRDGRITELEAQLAVSKTYEQGMSDGLDIGAGKFARTEARLAEKEELLIELRGDAERAYDKLTIALDRETSLRSGVDAVREAFALLDAAREEKD